jgi:apolipoprotein N-acyltransferase
MAILTDTPAPPITPTPDAPTRTRAWVGARAVGAGLLIAASVPPWGWWPLAFVGIAMWDRLVADQGWRSRFGRTWIVAAAWLFPGMLWMWDLTQPGYVIACASYAAYFGLAVALVPPGRARWIALPGAIVLAEQARWSFPFGGVPLANIALGQAAGPFAPVVRIGGPLLLVALVVVGGIALSAAWTRRWTVAIAGAATVAAFALAGYVAPHGHDTGKLTVAAVQGGGPQRTRAADTDDAVVFQRHMDASKLIKGHPQLVLWPENVVNVEGPITEHAWFGDLQALARRLDTTLSVGVVEGIDDKHFKNEQIVIDHNGKLVSRYEKVRVVPFGEKVPFRRILEKIAGRSGLPARDALAGSGPGVLHSPVGKMGVMISWEVFFSNRARAAVDAGGDVLLNPTNGSSYWLTQVQTQQIASSRLRALETGRWLVQAAPTGFSAIVSPNGKVLQRTGISEQRVLQGTVQRRSGDTLASLVGPWPMLLLALGAYPLAWWVQRREDAVAASAGNTAGVTRLTPTTDPR